MFPIRKSLQQDALSSFLYTLTLEYAIMKVQAHQKGLKLNGKHQLLVYTGDIYWAKAHYIAENQSELKMNVTYRRLVYADDADLKGINQDTRKKTKYSCVHILQEKITTYRQINSHIHGSGYNKSKACHKCKYLETKLIIEMVFSQDDMSIRKKLGNACHHSVQNLTQSRLISEN